MTFSTIKEYLKKNLSDSWFNRLKIVREIILFIPNFFCDAYRYAKYSVLVLDVKNKSQLRAMLTKNFHIIEKGLSLASPRLGFGRGVIQKTTFQLDKYVKYHGVDTLVFQVINTLDAYVTFNKLNLEDVSYLEVYLKEFRTINLVDNNLSEEGGVIEISRNDVLAKSSGNFSELSANRFSIRVFDEKPVEINLIKEAANIARKTPSVCNRQSTRIFIFGDEKKKSELLTLQNGNRGFGHTASHIAVITSDLHCFTGIGERNQAYVDGGLMAMSFVYALQSLGVGSCFLNWSVTVNMDKKIKKVTGIPNSHVIVTLIAIGNIPDELKVAASPRLPLEEIVSIS